MGGGDRKSSIMRTCLEKIVVVPTTRLVVFPCKIVNTLLKIL